MFWVVLIFCDMVHGRVDGSKLMENFIQPFLKNAIV
jgi:hypothetical protein